MGKFWKQDAENRTARDAEVKRRIAHELGQRKVAAENKLTERMAKIEQLGIEENSTIDVETKAGVQTGVVKEIARETGHLWVEGVSPESGHPSKLVMCSPFSVVRVHEVEK